MVEVDRLSLASPTSMAESAHQIVDAGEDSTARKGIRNASRLRDDGRQLFETAPDVLHQRWDAGKASSTADSLNMKELLAEERERFLTHAV